MSALSCGTSNQSERRTPILQDLPDPVSVLERKIRRNNCFGSCSLKNKILHDATALSPADLLRCSCRRRCSPAGPDQSSPAVDVVDLLCGNPGARLVIWGDGHSVLPTWRHKHDHFFFLSFFLKKNMNFNF